MHFARYDKYFKGKNDARESGASIPAADDMLMITPPFPPLSVLMCSSANSVPRVVPFCNKYKHKLRSSQTYS